MTKAPDWERARKAAEVVAKCAAPPFWYQVRRSCDDKPFAITLTRWTAYGIAKSSASRGQGPCVVIDMDGEPVADPDEDDG